MTPIRQDIGILLLHGLPENVATDPFLKLQKLEQAIMAYVPVVRYPWNNRINVNASSFLLLAAKGELGQLGANSLGVDLATTYFRQPGITQWILGGYSSGGWMINQWLFDRATSTTGFQDDLNHVLGVFTIGSPFRNVYENFRFPNRERPIPARTWDLCPEGQSDELCGPSTLAYALAKGHYCTVRSPIDDTVRDKNTNFPEPLVDEGLVQQLSIQCAHHDLPARDETITFVCDWLRSIL